MSPGPIEESGHSQAEECEVTIPEAVRRERADKVLAELRPELSRSRWQKLFQSGLVWLDDRVLRQKDKLSGGDLVQFQLPHPTPCDLRPVPMELSIVHEESGFLVLSKAPGIVVHPGAGTGEDTLVHGLLAHCPESFASVGGRDRPGIVHRLDKETSGLMVVAKTEAAYQSLSTQFAEREVGKVYSALVAGTPDPPKGQIDAAIGRHPVHRTRMACRKQGRSALSEYNLRESFGPSALVEVRIHTGRTHQVRVHMQSIGHSLLGDSVYGYKGLGRGIDVPRVMLHASRLRFAHPDTREALQFESPLPPDFEAVMEALRTSDS